MTYTVVNLGITESQLQTLLGGRKIFLEKSQFSGDVAVPLTKKQATSIATASRGINLKLSGPAVNALKQGEGFAKDVFRAALPVARKGVDWGLDKVQTMIPTQSLGPAKFIGDAAVRFGRKGVDWGVDRIQGALKKMLGGQVGIDALDAKFGSGFYRQRLLPAVESAARVALPMHGSVRPAVWQDAIDEKMGAGWFKDYLLPGIETAAKIAVPILRGRGLEPVPVDGEGFFSNLLGIASKVASSFGGGFTPMTAQKKGWQGEGMVL